MTKSNKLLINTYSNVSITALTYIINFFMIPFMIHKLGTGNYGTYILATSFTGYFSFMSFGVGQSLQKFVAEYNAQKKQELLSEVINASFVFYLIVGICVCIMMLFVSNYFIFYLNFSMEEYHKAQNIINIVALVSLVSWPASIFMSILHGLQKYSIVNHFTLGLTVLSTAVIIILLNQGYGIIALVIATNIIGAFGWIINWRLVKHYLPHCKIHFQSFKVSTLKNIFNFSVHLFIIQIAKILSYYADRLVLAFFLPVSAVAYYEVVTKPQYWIRTVVKLLGSAVMPAASDAKAQQNYAFINKMVFWGGRFTLAAVISISIPFLFVSKEFLSTWMGSEYAAYTLEMQIFLGYWIITGTNGLLQSVLIGWGRVKELSILALSSGVLNFLLSIFLVYKMGLIGALISTSLISILVTPIFMHIFSKVTHISLFYYLKETFLYPYLTGGVLFVLVYFVKKGWPLNNLPLVIGFVITGSLLYMIIYYFLGVNKEEKTFFKSKLNILFRTLTH